MARRREVLCNIRGGEKIKKMKNGETKKKFYEVCFVDRGGMGRGGEVRIVDLL